jgi:hypothetical protein
MQLLSRIQKTGISGVAWVFIAIKPEITSYLRKLLHQLHFMNWQNSFSINSIAAMPSIFQTGLLAPYTCLRLKQIIVRCLHHACIYLYHFNILCKPRRATPCAGMFRPFRAGQGCTFCEGVVRSWGLVQYKG